MRTLLLAVNMLINSRQHDEKNLAVFDSPFPSTARRVISPCMCGKAVFYSGRPRPRHLRGVWHSRLFTFWCLTKRGIKKKQNNERETRERERGTVAGVLF